LRSVSCAKQILDVNDAESAIQIAMIEQRESREPRLLRDLEAFGERCFAVQPNDLLPRAHHFARNTAAQVQRVDHDVVRERATVIALLRGREKQAQFLL